MNNEPVAWTDGRGNYFDKNSFFPVDDLIPLYTKEAIEEARKLGMQQERALWNLSASTQEIMDTHPVKEQLTDEEIIQLQAEYGIDSSLTCHSVKDFVSAILRKAQEK